MKKALKVISILAMISLLMVSFSSCKPRSLAIERVVRSSNAFKDDELKKFEGNVPPAEKTFRFQGKEYKLSYDRTYYNARNMCPTYEYWEKVDGKSESRFTFDFKGDLVSFFSSYNYVPPNSQVTADSCIPKAKEIFSEYVNDITQYQISTSEYSGGYNVNFTKYVDDIETADYAKIYFDFDGKFILLEFSCLNRIPADLDTNLFDMKAIRKAFLNQVKKDNSTDDNKITDDKLSEEKYKLVRGYNGQYAFLCSVTLYENTLVIYYVFLENRFPLS
ncbi:MAG: hypothetical protein MR471_06070 [Clostridia bacterium]|nr:hypothetical protein [Clostridia bacterium]MDY3784736.1 hypothetical protein [Eubacteriales bacterium]